MEFENLFSSDKNLVKLAYLVDVWTAVQTVCFYARSQLMYYKLAW